MKRPVAREGLWAVAAGFALLSVGFGSAGQTQDRPLRQDASATVKLIAVRVLGPDGRSVTGLKKEEFALFEDGRKKTITEFEIHAVSEAGMTVSPTPPAAAEAAVRESAGMNRKFFFFFDLQAADLAGKAKAHAAALHFLDTQARPGDQAAVIGFYAMSGFFVREYLTTDRDVIRKAIKGTIEAPPSPGEIVAAGPDDTRRTDVITDTKTASAVAATDRPEFYLPQPMYVPGTSSFQRRDFVDRMEDLAEVLKTIPGVKNLVLFTSRNLGAAWEKLGKMFGAAGVAIFAINTQDWKMGPFGTKFHYIWWDHSLKSLASASGGRYLADINDYDGNARNVQDLTGHFYVLGYYVPETWEGKYHKIRVEVARPGIQVLVQDGYSDPKPFSEMTDFEREVQLFDLIWSDSPVSRPLAVPVEALITADGEGVRACLLAEFDVGAKADVPAAKVEVLVLLRNESGDPLISRKWDLDLASYHGRILCPYLVLPVPAGAFDFRMVVRDKKTGEALIGRTRFDAAVPSKTGIRLHSPLLTIKGPEVSFLKLAQALDKKGGPREPTLIDLFGLIPKDSRPVFAEISAGVNRLTAVLPVEIGPTSTPDEPPLLAVEAKLISRPGGVETPLELVILDQRIEAGKPDILVSELLLPAGVSGVYDLEIAVEDVATGRRAVVRKALLIRS